MLGVGIAAWLEYVWFVHVGLGIGLHIVCVCSVYSIFKV